MAAPGIPVTVETSHQLEKLEQLMVQYLSSQASLQLEHSSTSLRAPLLRQGNKCLLSIEVNDNDARIQWLEGLNAELLSTLSSLKQVDTHPLVQAAEPGSRLGLTSSRMAEMEMPDALSLLQNNEAPLPSQVLGVPAQRASNASPAGWKVLLLAVAFILVAYCGIHHFAMDHSLTPSEADHDAAIWKCAGVLSGEPILQEEEDPNSPRVVAVHEFLAGTASEIEVLGDHCTWQTVFGRFYSMFVLRESLSVRDSSWHPKRKLSDPSDICHWARVKCDLNKNVQGIFLNHANLTGTIPKEIVGVGDSLRSLHLYSNDNLIGALVDEIGALSSLEALYLQETSIGGSIPSSLGSLTNLKELLLDKSHLTGVMPNGICKLRSSELESLHADCKGPHPKISCKLQTCCTACY